MGDARKIKPIHYAGLFLFYFVLIFCYFHAWRSHYFYGDDLTAIKRHIRLDGQVLAQLNMSVIEEKFRPLQSVFVHFFIELFGHNTLPYFIVNVTVQAINSLLVFAIIRMLTGRWLVAFLFSLPFALSELVYFNVSQLIYGATQEGFSTGFFLASMYMLLAAIRQPRDARLTNRCWQSILYANLSIYAHERYIVVFPCMILCLAVVPLIPRLRVGHRLGLIVACIASVAFNIGLKTYLFRLSFLRGTAGKDIQFNQELFYTFYQRSLDILFAKNPDDRTFFGRVYWDLDPSYVFIIDLLRVLLLLSVLLFLVRLVVAMVRREGKQLRNGALFAVLLVLMLVTIVPACVTIRLEPRWLQGPFAALMVLCALVVTSLTQSRKVTTAIALLVAGMFTWIGCHYFVEGVNKTYIYASDRYITKMMAACTDGRIRPQTTRLLIYEPGLSQGDQDWVNWVCNEGYLFDFMHYKHKDFGFVDTGAEHKPSQINDTTQVIYVYTDLVDTVFYPGRELRVAN